MQRMVIEVPEDDVRSLYEDLRHDPELVKQGDLELLFFKDTKRSIKLAPQVLAAVSTGASSLLVPLVAGIVRALRKHEKGSYAIVILGAAGGSAEVRLNAGTERSDISATVVASGMADLDEVKIVLQED